MTTPLSIYKHGLVGPALAMKRSTSLLLATALAAAGMCSHAGPIFSNGSAIGANGRSVLAPGAVTQGFGMQASSNNAVADDFTVAVGESWDITSIDFFAYQASAKAFTLQNVFWSIVTGDVNGGAVVASGTTALTNGGLLGYRVAANALGNTTRPIYLAQADVADFSLDAGHYWLRWNMSGSLSSGPWQVPTADGRAGNSMQSGAGGPFVPLIDAGSRTNVELPFALNGASNVVPEPSGALLALGAGLAALLAMRRRRAG